MPRVYATRAELVTYVDGQGLTIPGEPNATRMLTRASEQIDDLLVSAVYAVDDTTKLPTDVDVAEAFMLATCAQAAWWIETGDETGAGSLYQSVQIGSVSLGRGYTGAGSATGASQTLAPRALAHLRRAGAALQLGVIW